MEKKAVGTYFTDKCKGGRENLSVGTIWTEDQANILAKPWNSDNNFLSWLHFQLVSAWKQSSLRLP